MRTPYASSKAWVKSFPQALVRESAGTGIEGMAFNPGLVIIEMLTQVDVIDEFQKRMLPLNTVIRFCGNTPEVPARKAAWIASSATDHKNGLIVNLQSFGG